MTKEKLSHWPDTSGSKECREKSYFLFDLIKFEILESGHELQMNNDVSVRPTGIQEI
jgi:hypothetical protein